MKFIDIECYCWSTVAAVDTPMINAGMVFCDRHYGGINYPKVTMQGAGTFLLLPLVETSEGNTQTPLPSSHIPSPIMLQGGVGRIAELLVDGIEERGGEVRYRAGVQRILVENAPADGDPGEQSSRAVGVVLTDGTEIRWAMATLSHAPCCSVDEHRM